MNKNDPLLLGNQLCFPLYAASRQIIKKYRPFLDEIGLTYTQYITMMVIWEHNSISVKELGHKLFLDSGTLSPVLKSLEAKGYIDRRRSEDDERILTATVTEEGLRLKERASSVPGKIAGCLRLSPDDGKALYDLLYKLLDHDGDE